MRFEGFLGNSTAKEQLSGAFDARKEPQAILIDGPEGSGRGTLAGILAQAAVCESNADRPCGECRQCINAAQGKHPDIAWYTGTGGARSFSVDTVRTIRLDAAVPPNDAARKVYILSDIQNMTVQAQNAMLKIIEEPPPYTMFILTCAGRSRVLPTIQSRCFLVLLGPVSEDEAIQALCSGDSALSCRQAQSAARFSGGIIGQARANMGSESCAGALQLAESFTKTLGGTDCFKFIRISGGLEKNRELLGAFLNLLPMLFRDAICLREGRLSGISGCETESAYLANIFKKDRLFALMQTSLEAKRAAERHANETLLLTWLFMKMWNQAHGEDSNVSFR